MKPASDNDEKLERLIHRTLRELPRRCAPGTLEARVMAELERTEPDLAEYTLENLTAIFHRLLEVGAPAKQCRDLHRQIESVVLICITAMRKG